MVPKTEIELCRPPMLPDSSDKDYKEAVDILYWLVDALVDHGYAVESNIERAVEYLNKIDKTG